MPKDDDLELNNLFIQLAYLEIISYHLPIPMCMVDENMNYLVFSKKWETLLEHSDKPKQGDNHYDLFPTIKKDYPQFVVEHQECLKKGKVISQIVDDFQGIKIWYTLQPVKLPNERNGMIMIINDFETNL
ncbi:hypothetical protein WAF17_02750 [Bernardetia sp. ABR2-2B]|uniref:hypothetical protein n=1 Tax=Bernardetia sp. ABR2-2B TaxID=3127472 RepID=UPI0030D38259